jgi:hypothetical protein
MKKIIHLLILFMGFYFNANCQTMPTIGEIYDFDINDEFQSREFYDSPWPSVKRYVITDKFYSYANDTVFYGRHFDNYTSTWDFTPPGHMVYYFHSYSDTVFYTNLDTLINAPYANELIDSCNISSDTLYYSSDFCGAYSYEHYRCLGCCFEGQLTRIIYGIGIGTAYYHYNYPSEWYEITRTLFYYKKGAIECGEPDLLAVSVNEPGIDYKTTQAYPNPANQEIQFNTGLSNRNRVAIYNSLGIKVLSLKEYIGESVNVSSLENGFYLVLIENDQGTHTCKFVIDRN